MAKKTVHDLMERVLASGGKTHQVKHKGAAAFLPLRVAPALKKKLQAAADSQGVSLNLYMQDLLAAKANGNPDANALDTERAQEAQRTVKQRLETSTASVRQVRERLDGLRKFWRGLVADVESALRTGQFSFWRGEPDEETKRMLAALEKQMDACAASLSSTRDEIVKARPKRATVLDRALGRE